MPKCINKITNQIAEYEKIEKSNIKDETGKFFISLPHKVGYITPEEFNKFFKPLDGKLSTEIETLQSSIEKEKCKSKNKGNGIWVKRRIYYCVSFYDDVIPYREGNVEFETATLSREEPWKECQFVSIELDIIKDMVCQKYCKQLKEIEQFQVDKIEIIEKR